MPRRDDAPRDLLFGLLALQNGLVTRDQLAAAVAAPGPEAACPRRAARVLRLAREPIRRAGGEP
jgi:hypothetical protein